MRHLLQPQTLLVMFTAAFAAIFGIYYAQENLLFQIFFRILYFGETLFHELGHTLFFWLFGSAAIPSIMTAIGADKAGEVSLVIGEYKTLQWLAYGGMLYACYYCFNERRLLFYPILAFTILIVITSRTAAKEWLPIYMVQSGSILADNMPHWTLPGLALFTLILSVVLVGSFAIAAFFAESEQHDAGCKA
ncbi:MAG: hypothetical protein ACOYNL_00600 [Rickettsiales bacterium]